MNLFELEDYLKEKQFKGEYIGNSKEIIRDLKEIFTIQDLQRNLQREEL